MGDIIYKTDTHFKKYINFIYNGYIKSLNIIINRL